jgi:hypothetical protein
VLLALLAALAVDPLSFISYMRYVVLESLPRHPRSLVSLSNAVRAVRGLVLAPFEFLGNRTPLGSLWACRQLRRIGKEVLLALLVALGVDPLSFISVGFR